MHTIRLANGKMVKTVGSRFVSILFGCFHYIGKFHILDCDVPLILGMEFLSKTRPFVDFM